MVFKKSRNKRRYLNTATGNCKSFFVDWGPYATITASAAISMLTAMSRARPDVFACAANLLKQWLTGWAL
jgi:hypothetical protein